MLPLIRLKKIDSDVPKTAKASNLVHSENQNFLKTNFLTCFQPLWDKNMRNLSKV